MSIIVARRLRKAMSPAEATLWNLLRQEPFARWHFRRQVALGPYYADFASHSGRLVIEVDGDTHGSQQAVQYDEEREIEMRRQGYDTLRISNRDVIGNLNGVGMAIEVKLGARSPTRPLRGHPPHKGEG